MEPGVYTCLFLIVLHHRISLTFSCILSSLSPAPGDSVYFTNTLGCGRILQPGDNMIVNISLSSSYPSSCSASLCNGMLSQTQTHTHIYMHKFQHLHTGAYTDVHYLHIYDLVNSQNSTIRIPLCIIDNHICVAL